MVYSGFFDQQIQHQGHQRQGQQDDEGLCVGTREGQQAAAGGGHQRRTDQIEVHDGEVGGEELGSIEGRDESGRNGGARAIGHTHQAHTHNAQRQGVEHDGQQCHTGSADGEKVGSQHGEAAGTSNSQQALETPSVESAYTFNSL